MTYTDSSTEPFIQMFRRSVFPSQGWVRLKQGVSLGRFSTLALWNGLWKQFGQTTAFGTPVKFIEELKGLCSPWMDWCFQWQIQQSEVPPFTRGWKIKNMGIVLPWKGREKTRWETVLKERYNRWCRHPGKAVSPQILSALNPVLALSSCRQMVQLGFNTCL